MFRRICEYISLDLFYFVSLTSSFHSFLGNVHAVRREFVLIPTVLCFSDGLVVQADDPLTTPTDTIQTTQGLHLETLYRRSKDYIYRPYTDDTRTTSTDPIQTIQGLHLQTLPKDYIYRPYTDDPRTTSTDSVQATQGLHLQTLCRRPKDYIYRPYTVCAEVADGGEDDGSVQYRGKLIKADPARPFSIT